jgi:hypothetical protein
MITTSLAFLKAPKFTEVLGVNLLLGILTIILFLVTCIWFCGWIYFDHREIQIVEDYFSDDTKKIKRLGLTPFLSMLFIGLTSGMLLGLSDQIRYFIPLAIFLWFVSSIAISYLHRKVTMIYISSSRFREEGVPKLVSEYYLHKPFFVLDFCALAALTVGLFLSWYSWYTRIYLGEYLAYVIAILTICLHEGILWKWRIERDRRIDELEPEILGEATEN